MVFDLDVPTIGAIPGPGFHWDSAMLCDVTICTEDTKMEVPHAQGGLVPGDGMGLMCICRLDFRTICAAALNLAPWAQGKLGIYAAEIRRIYKA